MLVHLNLKSSLKVQVIQSSLSQGENVSFFATDARNVLLFACDVMVGANSNERFRVVPVTFQNEELYQYNSDK